ncbi:MAG: hypothetical protein RJA34_2608 [Pseudomonadota bacterium]|jgi:hypothetical protein
MSDQAKRIQQLIAKCWADAAFKQRLLADPPGTLKAEGIAIPAGLKMKVVENTAQEFTLVIPARSMELSDQQLDAVAGGTGTVPSYWDPSWGPYDPSLDPYLSPFF